MKDTPLNLGARSQMRLPNGSTQTYSYDSHQRLSTIVNSVGPKTFTYSYNTDNSLKSIVYPNTMANRFTYDSLYRLSNVSGVMYEEPEEMYYSIAYQYDANGNRTRAAWDSDEGISTFLYTKNYAYDSLNQLSSEKKLNQAETTRLYEYQYLFDAAGNRTQMKYYDGSTTQTTTYQYNNGNQMSNRYKGTDEWEYTYDNNGNMTNETLVESGSQREFTWNSDNRLTYAENLVDSQVAEYTYDAMGRRIMRYDENCSTYTYYYYDGFTVIAEKIQEGGDDPFWNRIFTVGPEVIGNIFRISYRNGNSWSDAYYHYDAIGNIVMITDSSASVASSIDQEAYGNVKSGSQSGYHITTKEYDSNPEIYYFWQRWYDPLLGIFVSLDPKSRSIYSYNLCRNNSINSIDPQGLYTIDKSCNNSGLGQGGNSGKKSNEDECKERAKKITYEKIRKCVEKLCDKGIIKCMGCEGLCKPYPGEGGKIIYPIGFPGFDKNSIVVCPENIKFCGFNNNNTLWDIIIHEFAHLCRWNDGETGKGVPLETGKGRCGGNNSEM